MWTTGASHAIRSCVITALGIALVAVIAAGTASATAIQSNKIYGAWWEAATWSPPQVPGSADAVTIRSGHTVRIKRSMVTVLSLTIQSGGKLIDASVSEGGGTIQLRTPTFINNGEVVAAGGSNTYRGDIVIQTTSTGGVPAAGSFTNAGRIEGGSGWSGGGRIAALIPRAACSMGNEVRGNPRRSWCRLGRVRLCLRTFCQEWWWHLPRSRLDGRRVRQPIGRRPEGQGRVRLAARFESLLQHDGLLQCAEWRPLVCRGREMYIRALGGEASVMTFLIPNSGTTSGRVKNGVSASIRGGMGCPGGTATLKGRPKVNNGRVEGVPIGWAVETSRWR